MTFINGWVFGSDPGYDDLTDFTVDTTLGSVTLQAKGVDLARDPNNSSYQSTSIGNTSSVYTSSSTPVFCEVWVSFENSTDWVGSGFPTGPNMCVGITSNTNLSLLMGWPTGTGNGYGGAGREWGTNANLRDGITFRGSGNDPSGALTFVTGTLYKFKMRQLDGDGEIYVDGGAFDNQETSTLTSYLANGSSIRFSAGVRYTMSTGAMRIYAFFAQTDGLTWDPDPGDPTGLSAGSPTDTTITLDWTDPSNGDVPSSIISIERSLTSGSGFSEIDTVAIGTETYEDTGLDPGTTYYYRIRALSLDIGGEQFYGAYTSEVNETTTGGADPDTNGQDLLVLGEL